MTIRGLSPELPELNPEVISSAATRSPRMVDGHPTEDYPWGVGARTSGAPDLSYRLDNQSAFIYGGVEITLPGRPGGEGRLDNELISVCSWPTY
ncbi:MAG: hypothetical protein NVSMB27_26960 [Ktedonobacteraceae bacterium]